MKKKDDFGKMRGNAIPCIFNGVVYRSFRNAAMVNGVSYVALKVRVHNGQSHDDALKYLMVKKFAHEGLNIDNPMKMPLKPYKPWKDGT
jgi:hypothetical protein